MKVLVAWIGEADLQGPDLNAEGRPGPIAMAVQDRPFDRLLLLAANQVPQRVDHFASWLRRRTDVPIEIVSLAVTSPSNMTEIYRAAVDALTHLVESNAEAPELWFHLSPGTAAMSTVWVLLGNSRFPAQFLESSVAGGVKTTEIPFDIAAEFVPSLIADADRRLAERSVGGIPESATFGDIVYRSDAMHRLVALARLAANRSVDVLIEGESGTGKELLTRAIVQESSRRGKPFKVVNCGALAKDLVEAELFGHEKGSFSGAIEARPGYFRAANGGTIFLDEVGELPLAAQVTLLRAIQEREVTPVGGTDPYKVDVRVIAATNRDLWAEVENGNFREDLFYRLAVLALKVPPLREREGDLGPLIESLLNRLNEDCRRDPGFVEKTLSPGALRVLMRWSWPGNVRELQNTLLRAAMYSSNQTVSEANVRDAILSRRASPNHLASLEPIGDGIDLRAILGRVAKQYLEAAMDLSGQNKTKAARLLGLGSHQTLTKWLIKFGP